MGNSLLDILVFGRRAGKWASEYIQGIGEPARLSMDHVRSFERELLAAGVEHPMVGPMLLPDYLPEQVRSRQYS